MFANDTNISLEHKNVYKMFSRINKKGAIKELCKVYQWFLSNKLSLNTGKTKDNLPLTLPTLEKLKNSNFLLAKREHKTNILIGCPTCIVDHIMNSSFFKKFSKKLNLDCNFFSR